MFRQVSVHRLDANLLRIVWREHPQEVLRVFRLLTVNYGTSPAMFEALSVLLELCALYEEKYPKAVSVVRKNKYVDDFCAGADTTAELTEIISELTSLLSEGGFALGKWATNCEDLLLEGQPKRTKVDFEIEEQTSTLGLTWLQHEDAFMFKSKRIKQRSTITKRTVLSETTKLFDPLGWISPIIIKAKVLIQDLWTAGHKWDEALPPDIAERWSHFAAGMEELELIHVPRWVGTSAAQQIELHGFSDASERAYAACVYVVVKGTPSLSRLLIAKTKVAPVKTLSMPRLELCGAQLLAVLMAECLRVLELDCAVHCWTDAQIVLGWLSNHPSRWTTFVATRVSDILTKLPRASWSHVPSSDNPADIATRGTTPSELCSNTLWWKGPQWLESGDIPRYTIPKPKNAEDWPEKRVTTKFSLFTYQPQEALALRFSSYQRLIRVVAYCYRFLENTRRLRTDVNNLCLASEELNRSREALVKISQELFFNNELEALQRHKQIHRSSMLRSLHPIRDRAGLLRVGGRLNNANITFSERHPLILPCLLSRLIVKDAHHRTLHGGPQLTLSLVMRQYWIIHGKSLVRSVVKEYVRCARFTGKPVPQLMGSLPAARVSSSPAFTFTGVDYAGPFNIRVSKGRGNRSYKGYICLFVCMSTRGVHLEAVSDLTTATFLAALKRFISRRGGCIELHSDNGTTFHGAANELNKMFRAAIKSPEIAAQLENDGIKWKFIPPGAPHFGGTWEAAVKSVKHHLRRTIGESTLTYEELSTLLAQIEACLNSRPMWPISNNSSDLPPFTPGHFLIGKMPTAVPEPYEDTDARGPATS